MSTFGSRLKQFRKSLGLSQEEFGAKIGLTKSGVSKCEAGKSFMSEETLRGLIINYKANLNYLLTGVKEPATDTFRQDELTNKVEEILRNKGIIN